MEASDGEVGGGGPQAGDQEGQHRSGHDRGRPVSGSQPLGESHGAANPHGRVEPGGRLSHRQIQEHGQGQDSQVWNSVQHCQNPDPGRATVTFSLPSCLLRRGLS